MNDTQKSSPETETQSPEQNLMVETPKKKSLVARGLHFVVKQIAFMSAGFLARSALQHMVDDKAVSEKNHKNFTKETKKKSAKAKNKNQ